MSLIMGHVKREICRRFRTVIQIFYTNAEHRFFFRHRTCHSSCGPSVRFCVSSYLTFVSSKFWVRHFQYLFSLSYRYSEFSRQSVSRDSEDQMLNSSVPVLLNGTKIIQKLCIF